MIWLAWEVSHSSQRSFMNFFFNVLANYKWKESLSSLRLSRQPFIRSTSHLAGVLLRTQRSAVLSVKLFGWAFLEKAASSNTGRQAISWFQTGTFWMGTALVLIQFHESFNFFDAIKFLSWVWSHSKRY